MIKPLKLLVIQNWTSKREIVSMLNKTLYKKSSSYEVYDALNRSNHQLSDESHKPIIRIFKKSKTLS